MQNQIDSITKQKQSTNSTYSTNNAISNQPNNILRYRWSHGAYAHSSQECHNKKKWTQR